MDEPSIQAEASDDEPSRTQLVFMWYPRVAGLITLIASLSMISMAWKRRKFMFHRLVLGMAIHLMIYGLSYLIGTLAIPRDVNGYLGNFGTTGTCTAQGFIMFVSGRSAMIYYGAFSIYSYIGVLNGFDKKKYQWCEKWIHIFVHSFPIVMGVYILAVQGYNPGEGFCTNVSYPMGCELKNHVVCERGPEGMGSNMIIVFWIVPILVFMGFPTIIMLVLYLKVKEREDEEELEKAYVMQSQNIAIQSCVYLAALYWTQLPFIILGGLRYLLKAKAESMLPYVLASQINFALFGLWSMLTYRHFSIYSNKGKSTKKNPHIEDSTIDPASKEKSTRKTDATEFIFNEGEHSSSGERSSDTPTAKTAEPTTAEPTPPELVARKFSFNIFDGTNASGTFADFIHDGDSEDERLDNDQTGHWSSVQDQI